MTNKEFIDQLKLSEERKGLTKEAISQIKNMIVEEYKNIFPFEKEKLVPEEATKKVFNAIDQVWPEFKLEKIASPISYFQTIVKSALNEYKRNS